MDSFIMARSHLLIWCYTYLTLVAAAIVTNNDAINREMPLSNITIGALNGSETSKTIYVVEKDNSENDDICSTPECILTASNILKSIDSNLDPCDNFYLFACHGFYNSTIIPDGEFSVTMNTIITNDIVKKLRTSIEEESSSNEPRPYRLAKDFYKACMNETAIEERGLQPFLDDLKELGGWPVLEGEHWKEDDFNWTDSVYKFRRLGYSINHFIKFDIYDDSKNNSRRLIHLDQPKLVLLKNSELNDKRAQTYYRYMVDIAEILGANRTRAITELKESLEFELMLANITVLREDRSKNTLLYKYMTVKELSATYSNISWTEYFNTILAPQAQLTSDDIIVVKVPSYLEGLEILISKTSKRVQANYALWKAVSESLDYLTDNIRKRDLKFISELNGINENMIKQPRWKECINIVSNKLAISISSMYVRKYVKEDVKRSVQEIFNNIKNEFTKILQKVEWMDEKTRANALEKAASMTSLIGYPDELLDIKKLDEFYEKLELNANDYLGSILNLTIFEMNSLFSILNEYTMNQIRWTFYEKATDVNGFYLPEENRIQIPAGSMEGIFFNSNRPRYMNYGAIGARIGHEITHGFDNMGGQYDKKGNRVEWWEPGTKEYFLNKTRCINDQYGNLMKKLVGIKLDGLMQQDENVADNAGVKVAYYAYKEWVKQNGQEQRLPGLPYTPEQMFWISSANRWCGKYSVAELMLIIQSVHSVPAYRVQGPLWNIEEFSQDFNCPIGSAMNPINKCNVW